MQFSCNQDTFAKYLNVVSRIVNTKPGLPILNNVLFETSNGKLMMTATDLEISLNCWIGAEIKAEGKVGYISPSIAVVGQDPKNSVYKWGYKKDYKYFYDPNDKKHFDKGYEFKHLANLPKDRIPLDELLKDAKLETSNETIEAPKEEAAPAETPSENTPQ